MILESIVFVMVSAIALVLSALVVLLMNPLLTSFYVPGFLLSVMISTLRSDLLTQVVPLSPYLLTFLPLRSYMV